MPFHLISGGFFPFAISAMPLSQCLQVNKRELIGPTVLDIGTLSRVRLNQRGKAHTYKCTYAFRQFVSPIRFVSPNTLSR